MPRPLKYKNEIETAKKLLARGHTMHSIARKLGISPTTLYYHLGGKKEVMNARTKQWQKKNRERMLKKQKEYNKIKNSK